jgi:hypothetical protein
MDNIQVRKSSCNRLISSKEYYEKQKSYYKNYQKDYYQNNKEKLGKLTDDEKIERRRIYSRNYTRQKCNYKNIKILDERFNTNLDIDSYNNFEDFVKQLDI